jgi:hypothetical protein
MGLPNGYGTKPWLAEGACFPTNSMARQGSARPCSGNLRPNSAGPVGRSGDLLVGKVEANSDGTTRVRESPTWTAGGALDYSVLDKCECRLVILAAWTQSLG